MQQVKPSINQVIFWRAKEDTSNIKLPFYSSAVPCGFTSPAEDFHENPLSLDECFIKNPTSTFFVKATGDSMHDLISHGDLLIVDRSLTLKNRSIGLFILNGEFTVKRFLNEQGRHFLTSENPLYKPIPITKEMSFETWGIVTNIVRNLK